MIPNTTIKIDLQQDYPPITPKPDVLWWRWQLLRGGRVICTGWNPKKGAANDAAIEQRTKINRLLSPTMGGDKKAKQRTHASVVGSAT